MWNNRLFLILVFIFISSYSFTASAQTQKHNLMIGGNGSYIKRYRHNLDPVTFVPEGIVITNLKLNPTVTYFIIDNLGIGVSGDFQSNKAMDRENRNVRGNDHSYSVGPMVRYYFPFERWAIFPEAQFLIRSGKSHSYFSGNKSTNISTGSILKIGVGTSYFISSNVGLEGLISYTSENISNKFSTPYGFPEYSIVRNNINFSVGIQYYFNMGKRDE